LLLGCTKTAFHEYKLPINHTNEFSQNYCKIVTVMQFVAQLLDVYHLSSDCIRNVVLDHDVQAVIADG